MPQSNHASSSKPILYTLSLLISPFAVPSLLLFSSRFTFTGVWGADTDLWWQVKWGCSQKWETHEFQSDYSDSGCIIRHWIWIRSRTTYVSGTDLIWNKIWFVHTWVKKEKETGLWISCLFIKNLIRPLDKTIVSTIVF